jgi:hypothetical protein
MSSITTDEAVARWRVPLVVERFQRIGDMHAPKNAPLQVEARYQSVRIIAAYDASNLPETPGS